MNSEKIQQYFFIIAAVIAILDGALSLSESMSAVKLVLLIISGLVVGVLQTKNERDFIVSGLAVVFTGYVLVELLGSYVFLEGLGLMLLNFILFLASALLVVGITHIGNMLAQPPEPSKKKNPMKMNHKEIQDESFQKVWGIVVLVSVAFTFIILLAEMFFEIGPYLQLFTIIDSVITIIFIIDLFILYQQSKGFEDFVRNNVFDIIAAIPTVGALRGLKIVRAVRVIKSMNKGLKATKLVKMYKTSKFFSEQSYFNQVNTADKKSK